MPRCRWKGKRKSKEKRKTEKTNDHDNVWWIKWEGESLWSLILSVHNFTCWLLSLRHASSHATNVNLPEMKSWQSSLAKLMMRSAVPGPTACYSESLSMMMWSLQSWLLMEQKPISWKFGMKALRLAPKQSRVLVVTIQNPVWDFQIFG